MRVGYIFLALILLLFSYLAELRYHDLVALGYLIAAGLTIFASAVCNTDRL